MGEVSAEFRAIQARRTITRKSVIILGDSHAPPGV